MKQSLEFRAPVRIGDTVHATVTVREMFAEKKRVALETVCTVRNTVVIKGEALVKVGSRG
jgi:3-hydroxybutyryl-CoA dehydratase